MHHISKIFISFPYVQPSSILDLHPYLDVYLHLDLDVYLHLDLDLLFFNVKDINHTPSAFFSVEKALQQKAPVLNETGYVQLQQNLSFLGQIWSCTPCSKMNTI